MATEAIAVLSTIWTRISAAGESGTCWKKTGETIYVDHTDEETADTLPLSNENVQKDKAKRVPLDADTADSVITIPADNSNDIFYAIADNDNNENILAVDVVLST